MAFWRCWLRTFDDLSSLCLGDLWRKRRWSRFTKDIDGSRRTWSDYPIRLESRTTRPCSEFFPLNDAGLKNVYKKFRDLSTILLARMVTLAVTASLKICMLRFTGLRMIKFEWYELTPVKANQYSLIAGSIHCVRLWTWCFYLFLSYTDKLRP